MRYKKIHVKISSLGHLKSKKYVSGKDFVD